MQKIICSIAIALLTVMTMSFSATAEGVTYTGSFKGAGGKKSSGDFDIVVVDGKTTIRFKKNFRLSKVPDPKIAFGNGKYTKGTIFVKLKKFRGEQSYVIPDRLDPSKFSQVWLWCEKFSVPLAVGNLKAAAAE